VSGVLPKVQTGREEPVDGGLFGYVAGRCGANRSVKVVAQSPWQTAAARWRIWRDSPGDRDGVGTARTREADCTGACDNARRVKDPHVERALRAFMRFRFQ